MEYFASCRFGAARADVKLLISWRCGASFETEGDPWEKLTDVALIIAEDLKEHKNREVGRDEADEAREDLPTLADDGDIKILLRRSIFANLVCTWCKERIKLNDGVASLSSL